MSAKDVMMRKKTAIVRILCADYTLILTKVHEEHLITDREYNNLKNINRETVEGHVIEFVDKLMNKGENTCKTFLNLLQTDEDIQSTYPELRNLELNYRCHFPTTQADTGAENQAVVVCGELVSRLNHRGYINWLKAGRCLLILKEGLHPFIDRRMTEFHEDLLNKNSLLKEPCQTSCKPKMKKLPNLCKECTEWKREILNHHKQPNATLNWDNCDPPAWRTDHWELAKAYMPRGQVNVNGADQCDASALLYLMIYCNCFPSVEPEVVKEVIKFRNELMHSSELKVSEEWMKGYQTTVKKLVHQFKDVPQMAMVERQIDEMLRADLSILVSGVGLILQSDSDISQNINHQSVIQWEAELLKELLQELQHPTDDSETQNPEQLEWLVCFLQAHTDLLERFSAELQAISSPEGRK